MSHICEICRITKHGTFMEPYDVRLLFMELHGWDCHGLLPHFVSAHDFRLPVAFIEDLIGPEGKPQRSKKLVSEVVTPGSGLTVRLDLLERVVYIRVGDISHKGPDAVRLEGARKSAFLDRLSELFERGLHLLAEDEE